MFINFSLDHGRWASETGRRQMPPTKTRHKPVVKSARLDHTRSASEAGWRQMPPTKPSHTPVNTSTRFDRVSASEANRRHIPSDQPSQRYRSLVVCACFRHAIAVYILDLYVWWCTDGYVLSIICLYIYMYIVSLLPSTRLCMNCFAWSSFFHCCHAFSYIYILSVFSLVSLVLCRCRVFRRSSVDISLYPFYIIYLCSLSLETVSRKYVSVSSLRWRSSLSYVCHPYVIYIYICVAGACWGLFGAVSFRLVWCF